MDIKDIEILLEKYFEAETTAEDEEKILRFFRNSGELPENLEKLRPMFEGIYIQREEKPDRKFEKDISAMVDSLNKERFKHRYGTKLWLAAGIAAAIVAGLIYMNIWRIPDHHLDGNLIADTYSDPQKGYEAAKAIMDYVSYNYNKGLEQLNKVPPYPEETQSLIKALETYNKGFNKLEVITNINIK